MNIDHRVDMYRYGWELDNIKAKQGRKCDVLFYGSSTFGIWKDLEDRFADYRAINAGFGGSTSDEALYHYENIARPFCPKTVVWYYGDNEPVCSYSVAETILFFSATWEKFVADNPDVKIITIATKTSPARDEYAPFVRELNAWQKQAAKERAYLSYIETADICAKDGEYLLENYLPDQLHFGKKGYDILFDRIKEELDK
ncbi:MAG: hypothetical protein J6U35_03145 [Clostridia bacterium]|nr:hypothetical protein [Clostridia bacterium]